MIIIIKGINKKIYKKNKHDCEFVKYKKKTNQAAIKNDNILPISIMLYEHFISKFVTVQFYFER